MLEQRAELEECVIGEVGHPSKVEAVCTNCCFGCKVAQRKAYACGRGVKCIGKSACFIEGVLSELFEDRYDVVVEVFVVSFPFVAPRFGVELRDIDGIGDGNIFSFDFLFETKA